MCMEDWRDTESEGSELKGERRKGMIGYRFRFVTDDVRVLLAEDFVSISLRIFLSQTRLLLRVWDVMRERERERGIS